MVVLLRDCDLLAEWEGFMASIGYALRVKYGLGSDPSEAQSQRWADLTRQYIGDGFGREEAGDRAAKYLFPDYKKYLIKSEADTVSSLLEQVAAKK